MIMLKTKQNATPGVALAVWIAMSVSATAARAETLYVTDMLQLDLYTTAEMTSPPLSRLKSGDRLEVLAVDGRSTRVKTDSGQSGWVKSLYLVTKEPARTRLNEVERANQELEAELQKLRTQLNDAQSRATKLESIQNNADEQQTEVAAELKQLRSENAEMHDSLAAYAGSVPISWVLACLAVVLVGGFWLGWYWFDSRSRARHGGYRIH